MGGELVCGGSGWWVVGVRLHALFALLFVAAVTWTLLRFVPRFSFIFFYFLFGIEAFVSFVFFFLLFAFLILFHCS